MEPRSRRCLEIGRLPNLIIAGVSKCGTTSLFDYLAQHPDICPATEKEVAYFTPLREGRELDPVERYQRYFAHCGGQRYAMEATPSYCYSGASVRRAIRDVLGRPRIILTLRDPVDRLWSAYTFQRSLANLPPEIHSFEDYVAASQEHIRKGHGYMDSGYLKGLLIGFYAEYVPDWLTDFGDDLRVVFFEDLAHDPATVLGPICRWLGIDEEAARSLDYSVRNPTVHPRSVALARMAFAVKARTRRALGPLPRLRRALHRTYFRLNRGAMAERMSPEIREQLNIAYGESNAVVATALRQHGYEMLPDWLTARTPA